VTGVQTCALPIYAVNRGCVCSEGKSPDDGHNSARNMLNSVQVN
jgi:hypothetical protein